MSVVTIQGYIKNVGSTADVTYDISFDTWQFTVGVEQNSSAQIIQVMPSTYSVTLNVTGITPDHIVYYNSALTPPALDVSASTLTDYIKTGWINNSITPALNISVPIDNFFGVAGVGAGTLASVTGIPNIQSSCFVGNTLVLMANNKYKQIKDIRRGDVVLEDIGTRKTNVVARLYKKFVTFNCNKIPKKLIGNNEEIICTNHPIWCNNDNNRIFPKDIPGVKSINVCDYLYDIQFEDEGTFYANRIKVDSLPPNATNEPLPKELYFNQSKYTEYILLGEDDPIRNKPLITKYATIFSNLNIF